MSDPSRAEADSPPTLWQRLRPWIVPTIRATGWKGRLKAIVWRVVFYVYGESLGGGVATRLIAGLCKAGTPPAGLILGGTFSSLTDTAASHYPWLPVRLVLLDRYESSRYLPSIDCPILQLHGTHDDIVPFELGRRLFAAIPAESAGGIPKQFIEFPDAWHNDFPETRFRAAVREFLDRIAERQ